ncbi:hypothetical protein [Streptomyces sp. KR80]|uniref:hypothetical protein n=1 Tax=Streptomyces sp. KR80 TaxID=3457426 RepID=UPI003FD23C38
MRKRTAVVSSGVALTATLGGLVTLTGHPLAGRGPTSVAGTPASAIYPIAGGPVREIRYVDRDLLTYTFTMHNASALPVTIAGVGRPEHEATMLQIRRLTDESGDSTFTVAPGHDEVVRLSLLMTGCERVSSRAASMVGEVPVKVRTAGVLPHTAVVDLPERIRTQSPRDKRCPRSNSATRSPA